MFPNKLLKVLVVGGVITIAAINPFFGLLTAKVIEGELKKRKWKRFKDDLYYLQNRGLIKMHRNPDGSYKVQSTGNGRRSVKNMFSDNVVIKVPPKWDRQWRLVIFDIPAVKKQARYALLARLKKFGFVMLQRSVWAYPFDCQKEIWFLARMLEIENYIQCIKCSEISGGEYLKREFERINQTQLT